MDMQEVVALQQTPSYLIHVKQWWVFALLLLRLSNGHLLVHFATTTKSSNFCLCSSFLSMLLIYPTLMTSEFIHEVKQPYNASWKVYQPFTSERAWWNLASCLLGWEVFSI